ncbi:hypothetical protein JCGZ_13095 [Jatropha curcas]|uniref:Uncharacterized protein n=1 Tax=Jatropha curcas TaxID=180498 RepID=A0A067KLW6_JATCU|nr:hypothetical protein JCGZ_13095 [Jatropha curcas]
MPARPTDLRAMMEEMLRDHETHFRNMLTELNNSLHNTIATQQETILGEVRTLINISQNGNIRLNQTGGLNDKHIAPPNGNQTARRSVPEVGATSNAIATLSRAGQGMI